MALRIMEASLNMLLLCSLIMSGLGIKAEMLDTDTIDVPPTAGAPPCACAAFENENGTGEPLLSKNIEIESFKITCTDEGRMECAKMCINLAMLSTEKIIMLLCEKLPGTVDSLKPAAFYKICDDQTWAPANFSAADPICCQDHDVVPCMA